jgi:predicted Rossmann-fold nucleotide-binding protein
MINLLVAGSFNAPSKNARALREFAARLAEEIVDQGHTLLNGCLNEFDQTLAQSADAALAQRNAVDRARRLRSYLPAGHKPVHCCGTVIRSRLADWDLDKEALLVPEQVAQADAVVLVGGGDGTLLAANWARISGKPLLPVTLFGGAAERVFAVEMEAFDQSYAHRAERAQYEELGSVTSDWGRLARSVVNLAEQLAVPRNVAVLMSYQDDAVLDQLYESVCQVCENFKYRARRVAQENTLGRIVPAIMKQIEHSAFVVCDLTGLRHNVFYELGYAEGMRKPVVMTAREDTALPFDIHDHPTVFWDAQAQFRNDLAEKIKLITHELAGGRSS